MANTFPYYAALGANQRYDSGQTDSTLFHIEYLSIALRMYAEELSANNPGNRALAAAATASMGMQTSCRILVETYRHYPRTPHPRHSHYDVVADIVMALKNTANDELQPMKKHLRSLGVSV